jgi:Zn-dependent protease with chaperone function
MSGQVQFSDKLLWPGITLGLVLAVVDIVMGYPWLPALFMGAGLAMFLTMVIVVFAYPVGWYMKLRALDGLSPGRALFAISWRFVLAVLLTALLVSLASAARFLNALLPEWLQVVLAIILTVLLWRSLILDVRAGRRQRQLPTLDVSRSRSLTSK